MNYVGLDCFSTMVLSDVSMGLVYIPSILQQCKNNLTEFCSFVLVKFKVGVIIWNILYYGALLKYSLLMTTISIGKGWIVFESVEDFLNEAWHWYVHMFSLIITLGGECRIQLPFPIDCDFVWILECLDEILCIFLSNIIDLKVTNNEVEGHRYGFVVLEYWDKFNRLISVILLVFFQSVMCNFSRLWKTIHALSNFDIEFFRCVKCQWGYT